MLHYPSQECQHCPAASKNSHPDLPWPPTAPGYIQQATVAAVTAESGGLKVLFGTIVLPTPNNKWSFKQESEENIMNEISNSKHL